jgi:tripartite-type tricarboxylate transporter receptor subunit TctC
MPHMAGELFQQMTGVTLLHVPYKGGGPALVGLLAGEAALYWPGIAIATPHVKTGKLRALGVASKTRAAELPQLPTLAEQLNAPDYDVTSIFAFMAPARTPRQIIDRIGNAATSVLALPDVRKTYSVLGAVIPQPLSPEETTELFRGEATRWGKVVKVAGISGDR